MHELFPVLSLRDNRLGNYQTFSLFLLDVTVPFDRKQSSKTRRIACVQSDRTVKIVFFSSVSSIYCISTNYLCRIVTLLKIFSDRDCFARSRLNVSISGGTTLLAGRAGGVINERSAKITRKPPLFRLSILHTGGRSRRDTSVRDRASAALIIQPRDYERRNEKFRLQRYIFHNCPQPRQKEISSLRPSITIKLLH